MKMRLILLALGVVVFGLSAAAMPAEASSRGGGFLPFHHGIIPGCDNPWTLGKINLRFAYKERRYWGSGAYIGKVEEVKELAYRPWGPDFIPRRHCAAKVRMNDGKETYIAYAIGEKLGFAGMGYGVEWCVVGYDRNLAYGPYCRAARP